MLRRLYHANLLHKLLREIAIDEVLERAETASPQDFSYPQEELARVYEQVSRISPFQGMNESQLTAIAIRTLKLQKFKHLGWGDKVSAYFEEQKVVLDRVVFSLILVEDGALAQELFFRIAAGEDSFAQIARAYSQGDRAQRGGAVGPLFIRDLSPAIVDIIRKLQPGELSELFQIGHCYGFIRLDEFQAAELDEGMEQFLIDELFEAWIQAEIANDVGLDSQTPPELPIMLPQPILAEEPASEFDRSGLELVFNSTTDITGVASAFPPNFAEKETMLLVESTSELMETAATPAVTTIEQPELKEIEISTSFFFPDPQHHPALRLHDQGQG